jgi:hypothetical protein
MSFFKAFSILLWGSADMVGPDYKWKQSILYGAIVFTILSPFFAILYSIPYQGATPPDVPLLKGRGVFVFGGDRHGLKKSPFIDFKSEDGRTYRLQDYVGYDSILKFNEANPGHQEVYAEGFFLRDGLGRFWPTQVTTINGKPLLDKEKQNTALMRYRNPFDDSLLIMYLIAGLLWIASVFNITKIKKQTS